MALGSLMTREFLVKGVGGGRLFISGVMITSGLISARMLCFAEDHGRYIFMKNLKEDGDAI